MTAQPDNRVIACGRAYRKLDGARERDWQFNGSGRKPILLEINPEGGYVLTAEPVRGLRPALLIWRRPESEKLYKVKDFSKLGAEIVRLAESVLREHGIRRKAVGVCVGVR